MHVSDSFRGRPLLNSRFRRPRADVPRTDGPAKELNHDYDRSADGLLILASVSLTLARGPLTRIHAGMFGMSEEDLQRSGLL
jgi:hypothetical protein